MLPALMLIVWEEVSDAKYRFPHIGSRAYSCVYMMSTSRMVNGG